MLAINPDARRGMRKTLTGVPCKTGIAWSFDAANGEFLWAKQTDEQNIVARIDGKGLVTVNEDVVLKDVNKTYHVCPTFGGGRDWPQGAYNPQDQRDVHPALQCLHRRDRAHRSRGAPQFVYNTTNVGKFADRQGQGWTHRRDFGRNRPYVWSWETRVANYSPILATGGGLLFNGSMDRYLRALDADNGRVLWESRLPSQVVGGAITYSVRGRQYVAIAAGGGNVAGLQVGLTPEADTTSGSNAIYVFALPQ